MISNVLINPKSIYGQPIFRAHATALSTRERDVLNLLVEGLSNSEIGMALHLSSSTVKSHVKSIMNKFGVNHRVQVAVYALRQGLVH
jgi:DNA-binding NarL/FixJ family response regulator